MFCRRLYIKRVANSNNENEQHNTTQKDEIRSKKPLLAIISLTLYCIEMRMRMKEENK